MPEKCKHFKGAAHPHKSGAATTGTDGNEPPPPTRIPETLTPPFHPLSTVAARPPTPLPLLPTSSLLARSLGIPVAGPSPSSPATICFPCLLLFSMVLRPLPRHAALAPPFSLLLSQGVSLLSQGLSYFCFLGGGRFLLPQEPSDICARSAFLEGVCSLPASFVAVPEEIVCFFWNHCERLCVDALSFSFCSSFLSLSTTGSVFFKRGNFISITRPSRLLCFQNKHFAAHTETDTCSRDHHSMMFTAIPTSHGCFF